MTLGKYPKYKDSGVEWIGEIPEEWKAHRVDLIAEVTPGFPFDSDLFDKENGKPLIRIRDILTKTTVVGFTGDYDAQYLVKNGELIVGMDGDFICSDWTGEEALLNQRLCKISAREPLLSILRYSLNFPLKLINDVTMFTTVKHLSESQIRHIRIPLGSIDNQRAVAAYLDAETSKLQQLIDFKHHQIELLQEHEKAFIHQAVTKGLDRKAKMKDSGVEWIGDMPEGWKVKKLKEISEINMSNVDKKSNPDEQGVMLCNYIDVYNNEYITSKLEFMKATATDEQIKKLTLHKGDVIITKDSEEPTDIAVPALVKEEIIGLVCGYHLALIKPNKQISDGEFIFRSLQSKRINEQFVVQANGVTRFGIGTYAICNSRILVPPKPEQKEITEYLDSETAKIHKAINNIQMQIEKLEEYRKSLIYEVVTGKVKVS